MRGRALWIVVVSLLAALPLTAAADVGVGCHRAAFVGPVDLAAQPLVRPALAAVGEVLLADGSSLADGAALASGQRVLHGVFRNVGAAPVELTLGGGDHLVLGPQQTVSVVTAVEIDNERVCVCECECGFDTVQIRCDSSAMDCSSLDGTICEEDDGDEKTLSGCTKKYVKPATATPTTP